MKFILILHALLFSNQLYADVFVCQDEEQTSYQDTPCAHATKTVLRLKTPPPSREEQLLYQDRISRSNAISQQKALAEQQKLIAEQQEIIEQERREIAIEKRKVELLERELTASQVVIYPSRFLVYPSFRQRLNRHENSKPSHWGAKDTSQWSRKNEYRSKSNYWKQNSSK